MNKEIFQLNKKEICITSTQIKQAIDLLVDENTILQKEIDRLNNAFDELEKYLIEGTKEPHYVSGDMFWDDACEIILNKLKELRNK